jgi:hypothetical protein
MTWIGACLVAVFLLGAILGSIFSRQREDIEEGQAHSDKLDYPVQTDQEASIAALARAQIALAKDANAADKRQSSYNKRSHRISFWTAIGVGAYTVLTAAIVIFSVVQYGEIHRFNKKQRQFFADQIGMMQGQLAAMQGQANIMRGQLNVMEVDKRPWVAIDAAIADTFRAIHTTDQNAAMLLTLDFTLSNTGEAPAIYAKIWPALVFTGPPGDPLHYSKLHCDYLRTRPITENTATYTIFPGKTLPPLRNIFETPRQSLEAIQTAANGEVLGLVAVGCVDYGFVARPEHHQTGFAFEVSRKAAAIPGERCCAIDFFGNDVPATDLRVTLYPFGGFYAD